MASIIVVILALFVAIVPNIIKWMILMTIIGGLIWWFVNSCKQIGTWDTTKIVFKVFGIIIAAFIAASILYEKMMQNDRERYPALHKDYWRARNIGK